MPAPTPPSSPRSGRKVGSSKPRRRHLPWIALGTTLFILVSTVLVILAIAFFARRAQVPPPWIADTGAPTASAPAANYTLLPEYSAESPVKKRTDSMPAPTRPGPEHPGKGKTLVIVIDDAGYNSRQLDKFLKLPFPLTIAVLPSLELSTEAARLVTEAGKELIMHQPMQAAGGQNPGPKALYVGMSPDEVTAILKENMETVPGLVGINNHMGSAATRDPGIMAAVLELAKARGIYYLDSLTTSGTATGDLARRMNLHYWERDVFLDNTPDRVSILRAIDEGKKIAAGNGAAVMIGHVWSADLAQTLMEIYPALVEEGYSLSTISRLMLEEASQDGEDRAGTGN